MMQFVNHKNNGSRDKCVKIKEMEGDYLLVFLPFTKWCHFLGVTVLLNVPFLVMGEIMQYQLNIMLLHNSN